MSDRWSTSPFGGVQRNVPESEKRQVYAEYGIRSHASGQYEVDHLIPLELSGSNSIRKPVAGGGQSTTRLSREGSVGEQAAPARVRREIVAGQGPVADRERLARRVQHLRVTPRHALWRSAPAGSAARLCDSGSSLSARRASGETFDSARGPAVETVRSAPAARDSLAGWRVAHRKRPQSEAPGGAGGREGLIGPSPLRCLSVGSRCTLGWS